MAGVNPLEYAIQMERDGQAYYTEAAASTANPLGKKMYEGLAADERRHEEVLLDIAKRTKASLSGDLPKKRLVTLFSQLAPQLKANPDAQADDNKVIGKAIEMEKLSVDFYTKMGTQATTPADRALFARLVQEEAQHIEILDSTFRYLNDTGHWFVWEEQSILDGG